MSKKIPTPTVLSQRPDPPNVEEILADVEAAGEDDVIFRSSDTPVRDTDDSLLSGSVSYEDSSPGQERNMNNDNSPTNDSDRTPGSNIDTVYQQALQLIECTETLKSVPQQLTAMGEELQKLATEMVDSTERLKRQSDAVMKANVS